MVVLPRASNVRLAASVVPAGAEFDAAVDEVEIEPVDEAAAAALLAKIPRPRLFAMAMTRATTRSAMTVAALSPARPVRRKSPRDISNQALRLAASRAGALRRR